jgi:hypothetical protein
VKNGCVQITSGASAPASYLNRQRPPPFCKHASMPGFLGAGWVGWGGRLLSVQKAERSNLCESVAVRFQMGGRWVCGWVGGWVCVRVEATCRFAHNNTKRRGESNRNFSSGERDTEFLSKLLSGDTKMPHNSSQHCTLKRHCSGTSAERENYKGNLRRARTLASEQPFLVHLFVFRQNEFKEVSRPDSHCPDVFISMSALCGSLCLR